MTIVFEKLKEYLSNLRLSRVLPCSIAAVICVMAVGASYAVTGSHSHWIWITGVVVYLAAVILYLYFFRYMVGSHAVTENDSFLNSMSIDLLVKMSTPVMICNNNESIIWYNGAFAHRLGKRNAVGMRFESFTGTPLRDLKSEGEHGTLLTLQDRCYEVKCYAVTSKNKRYHLTLWNDCTELNDALKRLNDEDTQVAYIMIDNLEEIGQYAKEGTRAAANEIEKALKEWTADTNGILKEYQSDRYMFLFSASQMPSLEERKFDILDRIREIRVGENSLSVTISMGIAQVSGTLAEKERVAAEALDMALQRGGDQVVVKSGKGLEFYGGKSQTVQKRTKVRARVIANELASLISKSSNVLIMGHRAADFDCIGACLGVARLCSFCGVKFNIIVNPKDPNYAKCYDRIQDLAEYRQAAVFCNAAEAQELLGSDSLTVIVDVNNKTQLEAPAVAEISRRTVYIDHHRKTAEFEEAPLISYIEPSASSACELVAEILEQAMPSGMLTKEEADVMYAGILLDTKQFTRNAGVRTFSAALYLRGEGANPADAQTLFKSCLNDFISEAKFESNVVIYRRMMAISCNDENDNTASDRIAAAKAADKLLSVEGVKASFALCRIGDTVHVSARSNGDVNVQLILEKIEGGGHFDAAATQLPGSMTEVLNRLKNAIDAYLDDMAEAKQTV